MIKCKECDGTNIVEKMWVDPNTLKVHEVCETNEPEYDQWCYDCEKNVEFINTDNYCEECGQLHAVHNDDGSCVQDSGDALSESWMQKADESYEYERDNS